MKGKATILGHPIHPMLIALPLGLLPAAVICDFFALGTHKALPAQMAFWLIAGGILGGLLAAMFGLIDWLSIPSGTRAKRIGGLHGILNGIVLVVFSISWLLRRGDVEHPGLLPIVLGVAALLLAGVAGWFGAELIYRLNIGVDEGAHPDAPNSLTHKSVR